MKKFTGLVNGKSFDNEKDFNKAAAEAIKSNDGDLSISSYYSYAEDTDEYAKKIGAKKSEQKKVEKKETEKNEIVKVDTDNLKDGDYVITETKPVVNSNRRLEYPVSPELYMKLRKATNKDEIRKKCEDIITIINDTISDNDDEKTAIQKKIDDLKVSLNEKVMVGKELVARKDYYNDILNILDGTRTVSEAYPLLSYLRSIGFFDFDII